MRVLITAGKSALAYKLKKAFHGDTLFLADYGDMPGVPLQDTIWLSLGKYQKDALIHVLLAKCLDQQVDCLIPLYQQEIEMLLQARLLFEEFGITLLLPEIEAYSFPSTSNRTSNTWLIRMHGKLHYQEGLDEFLPELDWPQNGAFYLCHQEGKAFFRLMEVPLFNVNK